GQMAAQYGREFLGLHVMDITPSLRENVPNGDALHGVVVVGVVPGSPAADAQIAPYDIVERIAHTDVTDRESFRTLVEENASPGKALLFRIKRLPLGDAESESKIVKVPEEFKL